MRKLLGDFSMLRDIAGMEEDEWKQAARDMKLPRPNSETDSGFQRHGPLQGGQSKRLALVRVG